MVIKQESLNPLQLFLEDLIEDILRRNVSIPWQAIRSEYMKQAYKEVPNNYKVNESVIEALQTVIDIYTDDYKTECGHIMDFIKKVEAYEKPPLLRAAVEGMALTYYMKAHHGFLIFLSIITGISIDLCRNNERELIPSLIDATVSSIKQANLGNTDEQLFTYINDSINDILKASSTDDSSD